VEIAGRAFVVAIKLHLRGGCDVLGVAVVGGEDEVESLGVRGATAEAVAGAFV
jgi:hypothetical protein